MKVLVLGGSGFIGSHLTESLVKLGHEVTIFHQSIGSVKNLEHIKSGFNTILGDFNNESDLTRAVKGIDVVVHSLSATVPGNSLCNPAYDAQMNIISSINLLNQCVKAEVKKIVFISSGGTIYGVPQQEKIKESHPLNPISPYAISKLSIEKYLFMYRYQFGLDYTILRLSNPYGPRQDASRGQGVMAAWINKILKNEPIEIWGDGKIVRDYIYIADAVAAISLAVGKQSEMKVFNVGSGVGCSLLDLHGLLEKRLNKSIKVNFKPMQKVDVPVNVLDIGLIAENLNWRPLVTIENGIEKLQNYYFLQ